MLGVLKTIGNIILAILGAILVVIFVACGVAIAGIMLFLIIAYISFCVSLFLEAWQFGGGIYDWLRDLIMGIFQ